MLLLLHTHISTIVRPNDCHSPHICRVCAMCTIDSDKVGVDDNDVVFFRQYLVVVAPCDNLRSMINVEACDSFVSAFVIYPSAVVRFVLAVPHSHTHTIFFALLIFSSQNTVVCSRSQCSYCVPARDNEQRTIALYLFSNWLFLSVSRSRSHPVCVRVSCSILFLLFFSLFGWGWSHRRLLSFILLFAFRLSVELILIISYYGFSFV